MKFSILIATVYSI